jgi:hypothetical protein
MARRSTNPALSGLQATIGAGWDPATGGVDESGRNLHQRSVDSEANYYHNIDPALDPMGIQRMQAGTNMINAAGANGWSDWLQTLKEKAPGGIATPSKRGDPMSGLTNAGQQPGTVFDPLAQHGKMDPAAALAWLSRHDKMLKQGE